jgi:hypothetical protein
MNHVQSLESRTLFSSSLPTAVFSDVLQLQHDVAAARADLLGQVPGVRADVAALNVSLHGVPVTKQNLLLVATLRKDAAHSLATMQGDVLTVQRAGTAAVGKAVAAGMALSARPTSTVAQAKLAAALAGIQTFANNTATKLQADAGTVQAVISADLTALATANPTNANLQAAVGKMGGDLASLLTSAGSHLPVIEADLQQVLTDFGTGA